jgi:hypothetical protein
MIDSLNVRIRDRLSQDWLTSSQRLVWQAIRSFDGPVHRVINIYGAEGTGKTFLGWLLEREQYSSYAIWSEIPKPVLPRLTLDDAIPDRLETRAMRPLVDKLGIKQIILLSRSRVDEPDMPAFELHVTEDDLERFRANLYRYLSQVLPEGNFRNYKSGLEMLR